MNPVGEGAYRTRTEKVQMDREKIDWAILAEEAIVCIIIESDYKLNRAIK